MLKTLSCVVLLLLYSPQGQAEISSNITSHEVMVGDMMVPEAWLQSDDEADFSAQGMKVQGVRRWPGGVIPYVFTTEITPRQQQEFQRYCAEMGEFARVSCRPKTNSDRNYIVVQRSRKNHCGSSYLGQRGGAQDLKIRCWGRRTIQHELLHAFGVSHEHNRHDRDQHITMLWENLKSSNRKNYAKISAQYTSHYLSYYDFDSIMHYESRAGTKNGRPVFYITQLGPSKGLISGTHRMSYGDHYILYALYGGRPPQ